MPQILDRIFSSNLKTFFLLLGITSLFYSNILLGGFVFDDNIFIENNTQVKSLDIAGIYRSSTTAGAGLSGDNFYRPNQQLIYATLHALFGLSPFWFHLVSILAHVINGFLLFLLFIRIGFARSQAVFGSALFLLHPILTQAVSYVSGLSEPLVLMSILGTVILFDKSWFVASAVVFAVGLFSKENQSIAIGLVALLAYFRYMRGELEAPKKIIVFIFSLLSLSFLYFLFRPGTLDFSSYSAPELSTRLLTFLHVLPQYAKMLFWPLPLYYEKPYTFVPFFTPSSLLSIALIISGIWASFHSIVKKRGEIFLGLGWFAVVMTPFLGIVPMNAVYLEHWLYIPIIGIIICLIYFFDFKKHWPIIFIVLILFGVRITFRNLEWGDPIKFYKNELRYTDNSARIYVNLGMEFAERGDCSSAMSLYRQAIGMNDTYPQTHHNLAVCLEETGDISGAKEEYLKALKINPYFPYSRAALEKLLRD